MCQRSSRNTVRFVPCAFSTILTQKHYTVTTQMFGSSRLRYYDSKSPFHSDLLRNASEANATLRSLESALANATAMAMWSAARAGTLTTSTQIMPRYNKSAWESRAYVYDFVGQGRYSTRLEPTTGSTTVTEHVLVGRITVRPLPLETRLMG